MSVMKQFLDTSYLFGGNAPFIEELYESYLDNPQSIPEQWREYFDALQVASGADGRDVASRGGRAVPRALGVGRGRA